MWITPEATTKLRGVISHRTERGTKKRCMSTVPTIYGMYRMGAMITSLWNTDEKNV